MPKPYIVDANGIVSYDVSYEIEGKYNKYNLKVVADEAWLNDEERSYPVIIDPYIFTEQNRNNINVTYVSSVNANTNYDYHKLQLGNKESHGKCRILVKMGLDDLNPGDMITSATLNLYQYSHWFDYSSTTEPVIAAYRVESSWNETSVTWNTQPSYDKTSVLDYDYLTRTTDKWKSFDITSALKRWYDGSYQNHGIMLQLLNEDISSSDYVYGYYLDDANSEEAGFPYIAISYINNKGLESYFDYTSGSNGSAGTYYVDNYSGNLVIEHVDKSTVGSRFPASVIHYYNSYNYNNQFDTTLKVGKGWKLNIFQTIKPSSTYGLSGDSAETFPYVWMDGDGTEIYFKKTEDNKLIDETGRGFELSVNGTSGYTITDKSDQTMSFNQHGKLIKITDVNGNSNTFDYEYGLIKKVWDSAGHYLTLNYENNFLTEIVDMANRKTTYEYNSNDQLHKIIYPDGYATIYYYNANGSLIQMQNKDSTRINFEYSSLSDGMRVTKTYDEASSGAIGQTMLFSRNEYNTTKLTTSGIDSSINTPDDITSILQYDDAGRITSNYSYTSYSELGGGVGKFSPASSDAQGNGIKKLNRLISSASISKSVNNIASNHSGETNSSWTSSSTNLTMSSSNEAHLFGCRSFKLVQTSTSNGTYGIYQSVKNYLAKNTTYTLSAYVKVDTISASNGGAFIRAKVNGTTYESEKIDYHTDGNVNSGWRRISVSFTTPNATISEGQILLGFKNAHGTIYFDGIQLEVGGVANPYNMFENGG